MKELARAGNQVLAGWDKSAKQLERDARKAAGKPPLGRKRKGKKGRRK